MDNIDFNGVGLEMVLWFNDYLQYFIILLVWSIFWKGLALWHSARRGESWWFIFILLVNSVGILELIYLFGVVKIKREKLFK